MSANPWLAARNILAVRLDNTGDVVMLGPALRAVKAASPAARVTLLASPAGALAAPLLPWIDDVIVWRAAWQEIGGPHALPFAPARERELIDRLAAGGFDAALIFTSFSQTPHVAAYACYLAGIPLRAGESKEFGGATLSSELKGTADDAHQVERNLRLVETLGFAAPDRRLAVAIPDQARAAVPALLDGVGLDPEAPFILLHPGASARARRYPAERYGAVARLLRERGWPLLVTGVERERETVETLLAVNPGTPSLIDGTTLPEYAALVARAALVICGNTLPLHLADAVGTPIVALYAGTDLESQWRPRTVPARLLRRPTPCAPCYRFDCPIGLPCLDIPPEEVAATAETMLGGVGQKTRNPSTSRKMFPASFTFDGDGTTEGGSAVTTTAAVVVTPAATPTSVVGARLATPTSVVGAPLAAPVARGATRVSINETVGLRPTGAASGAPTAMSSAASGAPTTRSGAGNAPIHGADHGAPLPARIAVLRALFLGDLLCASPALRDLRARFPTAEISLIGLPWAKELVARWPFVDRLVPFPGWPGLREVPFHPERTKTFLAAARDDRYDLAVNLHGRGPASTAFVAALGARATLAYAADPPSADAIENAAAWRAGQGAGDEEAIRLPWRAADHEIHRWLRLVAALGPTGDDPIAPEPEITASGSGVAFNARPDFPITAEDDRRAAALLAAAPAGTGPLVALHPGAKDAARRWPVERFAALGDRIAADHGARLLLTGGEHERPLTAAIRARLGVPALDLAGATELGTFAALIGRLDLLVSNDTGASHLAAARRTASVVLFGPSDPAHWAPLDLARHRVVDAAAFVPMSPAPMPAGGRVADLAALPVLPVLRACAEALAKCDHPVADADPAVPQDRAIASASLGTTLTERTAPCAP